MANEICEIKMRVSQSYYTYITVILTSTTDNNNNNKREGSVTFSSKQTSDIITLTLPELQQLLDKFERSQFDDIIVFGEWPTPATISSHQLKLFMYDCGEFFSLEYRNCRVKIDRNIIHKLLYIEEKLKSFINIATDAPDA